MNRIKLIALTAVAAAGLIEASNAAIIPYPNSGVENSATYNFTAANSGDIVGYFAAPTSAAYIEVVGLMVNGVLTENGFGLTNRTSAVGSSFNFGHANAGDTLTFVLRLLSPPLGDAYSDPSLNGTYDGGVGHQHVYSANYNSGSGLLDPSVPSGVYVAFEDLPASRSDWNYGDDTFVFTNVTPVPEPTTMVAGALLLLPFGMSAMRRIRKNTPV